ncbi:MAG: type II toxin-antitoxin system mRNA interferase toxin, RelE/StbE family [Patescibacteria group bacterium]
MAFRILYAPEFKRDYQKLTPELKQRLKVLGVLFEHNPFDPRLRTHKLTGKLHGRWSFSLDYRNRALFCFLPGGAVLLLRVGDHSIYRRQH